MPLIAHNDPENTRDRTLLDKMLRPFADVHAGEATTVLLLALNFFLVLTSYYIIKPVREALILSDEGAVIKSYASAGQALLFLVAVPLYAKLADKVPRKTLLNAVTLFFAACMVLFYVLAQFELPLGIPFYLWVGIFNMMFIAQCWAFANDVYTPDQGRRLFAIVAFGSSSGAVFGSFISGRLVPVLGIFNMLLLAAAILTASLVLTNWVFKRELAGAPKDDGQEPEEDVGFAEGGAFELLFKNKYLLLIAVLLLLLNWVNSTGEFILGSVVESAYDLAIAEGTTDLGKKEYIGAFYSDFFSIVNLVGLLVQLFLVSRILDFFGVRVAILILPVIALGAYALLAFYPILAAVRWAKTAENATDYSLNNTVRGVLFLPTTREEKYKAKQAIDTVFVRAGDVLSALVVFFGTKLAFETGDFALFNLALVVVWIGVAIAIGRRHAVLVAEAEEKGAAT